MFKPVSRFCCLLIFVLLFSLPILAALAMETTCPPSFDVAATLISGEKELTVYSDTDKTERVGKLKKGETAQVLGASGRYYRISLDGMEGYAAKNKLRLKVTENQEAREGTVVTDLALDTYVFTSTVKAKSMAISGTIETPSPLDTLYFHLWDERLQRVEQTVILPVNEPAKRLDIQDVCKKISFSAMTAGRKTLVISGSSDGDTVDLFQAPVYVCGAFKPVRNINSNCKFSAGTNKKDGSGRSWTPSSTRQDYRMAQTGGILHCGIHRRKWPIPWSGNQNYRLLCGRRFFPRGGPAGKAVYLGEGKLGQKPLYL